MKSENKTLNINFRVTPQFKKWLDILIDVSNAGTPSFYFNFLIHDQIKKLIMNKASIEGRDYAAKEFGLSDSVREAINKPGDIKGLFGNVENGAKFLDYWAKGAIGAVRRLCKELDFYETGALKSLLVELSDVINGDNINFIEQLIEENLMEDLRYKIEQRKNKNKEEGENALK